MSLYGPSAHGSGLGLVEICAFGSCETMVVKTGWNSSERRLFDFLGFGAEVAVVVLVCGGVEDGRKFGSGV